METNEMDFFTGDLVEIETTNAVNDISRCEWGCNADDV